MFALFGIVGFLVRDDLSPCPYNAPGWSGGDQCAGYDPVTKRSREV
jgi:hypothetical protein